MIPNGTPVRIIVIDANMKPLGAKSEDDSDATFIGKIGEVVGRVDGNRMDPPGEVYKVRVTVGGVRWVLPLREGHLEIMGCEPEPEPSIEIETDEA